MSTTIGCQTPGASQPKEPTRLIDADELLKHFNTYDCAFDGGEFQAYKNCMMYVRDLVNAAPTVDPESLRPTAHWISDSAGSTNVVCSACNSISFAAYNFCPECGKRMVNANERMDKR